MTPDARELFAFRDSRGVDLAALRAGRLAVQAHFDGLAMLFVDGVLDVGVV
ncbi:hypothetical protein ACIO8F_39790 [Streptomyces sp. NPDC087228]|uniref:hypothetical protein n=1 Tax=unclassified Streptomyces TaxID=2593676 RepID=UPI0033CDD2C0